MKNIIVACPLFIAPSFSAWSMEATSPSQMDPGGEDYSYSVLDMSLNNHWLASAGPETMTDNTSPSSTTSPTYALPQKPDWAGLRQDTKLFMLYQVATVAIIYTLPESVSKWSQEDKSGNQFKKWEDNINNMQLDNDMWSVNYIGHPYFGATYYVRARHRGFDRPGSFWYAAGMSAMFEYGIEAVFEPASLQDLIFTPVGGAVVGEYLMIGNEKIQNHIAATGEKTFLDSLGLFFTDPLGVINKKMMELYNSETENARLELQPIISPSFLSQSDRPRSHADDVYGIQALLMW